MTAEDIYTAAEELESRGIDASANPDLVEAFAEYTAKLAGRAITKPLSNNYGTLSADYDAGYDDAMAEMEGHNDGQ